MTTSPLLCASALSLERGGRALFSSLSLAVEAGQLWQIEGPNGAGKTSLMRILAGLSRYGYEGTVKRTAPILYLGHHAAVKGLLTPRENLRWHVSGHGAYTDEQIDRALAQVKLAGFERIPCHQLSAGQQRRVNLARLYLDDTPLWLLDEPFTAIDKAGVASLERRLEEKVNAGGAVLIVSHQRVNVGCAVETLSLDSGSQQ